MGPARRLPRERQDGREGLLHRQLPRVLAPPGAAPGQLPRAARGLEAVHQDGERRVAGLVPPCIDAHGPALRVPRLLADRRGEPIPPRRPSPPPAPLLSPP